MTDCYEDVAVDDARALFSSPAQREAVLHGDGAFANCLQSEIDNGRTVEVDIDIVAAAQAEAKPRKASKGNEKMDAVKPEVELT